MPALQSHRKGSRPARALRLPAVAAAVALSVPSPAGPTPPGRNGLIAFVRPGAGIALIRPDGGGLRRLTRDARDRSPAWSPDGRRLAFSRGGDLYAVRADGTALRRLTRGPARDGQPAWSPDGRRVVAWTNDGLALYSAEGTRIRRLVTGGAQPAWQPLPR